VVRIFLCRSFDLEAMRGTSARVSPPRRTPLDSGKDSGQKPHRSLHEPVFHASVIRKCSALVSLSSRIKPLLEVHLEARNHLFFNVFDVGELAPTSDITVFADAFNLHNEFLHQPSLSRYFSGDAVSNIRRLSLPERFNPGSRRQSGVSFDPDFSQFPNDFGRIDGPLAVYGTRCAHTD
jgi:hypothetical protein